MIEKAFIFGAGYSGKAFAAARRDPAVGIAGTARTAEKSTSSAQLASIPSSSMARR